MSYGATAVNVTSLDGCVTDSGLTPAALAAANLATLAMAAAAAGAAAADAACRFDTGAVDHVFMFTRGALPADAGAPYSAQYPYAWLSERDAPVTAKYAAAAVASPTREWRGYGAGVNGTYVDTVAAVAKALVWQLGAPVSALARAAYDDAVHAGDYTDGMGSAGDVAALSVGTGGGGGGGGGGVGVIDLQPACVDINIGVKHGLGGVPDAAVATWVSPADLLAPLPPGGVADGVGTTTTYLLAAVEAPQLVGVYPPGAMRGIRIPHLSGVPERWVYLSFRAHAPTTTDDAMAMGCGPGVTVHDVSFGVVAPDWYPHAYYRTDGASGGCTLLDVAPDWSARPARALAPGDAWVLENAVAPAASARVLVEVLAFNTTSAAAPSASVRVSWLHPTGVRSRYGMGCAVEGAPGGLSCAAAAGGAPTADVVATVADATSIVAVPLRRSAAGEAGSVATGVGVLRIHRASATAAAGGAPAVLRISSCPPIPGWNASLALYRTFPTAQVLYGAPAAIGAVAVSAVAVRGAAAGVLAPVPCGDLSAALPAGGELFVLIAVAGDNTSALWNTTTSSGGSGRAPTVQLTYTLTASSDCGIASVSALYDMGGNAAHRLALPLDPQTPVMAGRPAYRLTTLLPPYVGLVSASLAYNTTAGGWVQTLALLALRTRHSTVRTSSAWVPANATAVDATVVEDTIFTPSTIGHASGGSAGTLQCACTNDLFVDATTGTVCRPCGAGERAPAGTAGLTRVDACRCARNTGRTATGGCEVCPHGATLAGGVCRTCPPSTRPPPPGSRYPACLPAACGQLEVATSSPAHAINGVYRFAATARNGQPWYTKGDNGSAAMALAYVPYPVAQWQFIPLGAVPAQPRGAQQGGVLDVSAARVPGNPPPVSNPAAAAATSAVAAFFAADTTWVPGVAAAADTAVAALMPFYVVATPPTPAAVLVHVACLDDDGAAFNPISALPKRTPPGVPCHPAFVRTNVSSSGSNTCVSCAALAGGGGAYIAVAGACACAPSYTFAGGGACGYPSELHLALPSLAALGGTFVYMRTRHEVVTTLAGGGASGDAAVDASQLVFSPVYARQSATPVYLRYSAAAGGLWELVASDAVADDAVTLPDAAAAGIVPSGANTARFAFVFTTTPAVPVGGDVWSVYDATTATFSGSAVVNVSVARAAVAVPPGSIGVPPVYGPGSGGSDGNTAAIIVVVLLVVGVATALITLRNYNPKRARRAADNECGPSPSPVASAGGINVEISGAGGHRGGASHAPAAYVGAPPGGPPPGAARDLAHQHAHSVPV